MARLVEWHNVHARDAERVRFRSAVRRRRLRVWLRPIPCRCQRPVLVPPANEKILVSRNHLLGFLNQEVLLPAIRPSEKMVSPLAPNCSLPLLNAALAWAGRPHGAPSA